MTYGFIGLGNMATAILYGMKDSGAFFEDKIIGYDVSPERCILLKEQCGIEVASSGMEAAQHADFVFIAVKPQTLPEVFAEIGSALKNKPVLTIAAGKFTYFYTDALGPDVRIVRAMPNMNARAKGAITAICAGGAASREDVLQARRIFETVGSVIELPEDKFPIFGAIAGSTVAFVYLYIAALMKSCVEAGLSEEQSRVICAESVAGCGKLVLQCGEDPKELARRVCSPGGTTIEGVTLLESRDFEGMLTDAVAAILEKDSRIREGKV